jgi:hypothetical protein
MNTGPLRPNRSQPSNPRAEVRSLPGPLPPFARRRRDPALRARFRSPSGIAGLLALLSVVTGPPGMLAAFPLGCPHATRRPDEDARASLPSQAS